MTDPSLEREIDGLYSLPLAEFIGARNELTKRLKAAGDRASAEGVKKLAKPSVTAWAANALYHQERGRFDELMAAAAAVRAALGGTGNRREAEAAKRRALEALLRRAAGILSRAGHAATPASRQRIRHTLETLAARDPEGDGPRPGRLATDLEPQGFDVLAGLAASLAPAAAPAARSAKGAGKPARRSPATAAKPGKARDERLEAARRQLAEQEAALAGLDEELEEAEAAAAAAAERAERLAEEAAEARRLAGAAAKAAAAAKKELAAARAAATKARAARRRGLTRVANARRRIERRQT